MRSLQVTCFLAGLFGTKQAKSALVLAPKSVMRGWEDELRRWLVEAACPKAEVILMPRSVVPACVTVHIRIEESRRMPYHTVCMVHGTIPYGVVHGTWYMVLGS